MQTEDGKAEGGDTLEREIIIAKRFGERTPDDYLGHMDADVRASLTPRQLTEVSRLLGAAIPRPAPKIVDLRFVIDLIVARFHVVVMLGRDRRGTVRRHPVGRATRVANFIAGIGLLLALNLALSLVLFLLAYLLKSAAGIDLLPGHFGYR